MNYIFIINPISGGNSKQKLMDYIVAECNKNNLNYKIEKTEYAGHATIIASKYADKVNHCLVAVGGDGTVNEIAKALIHQQACLYVIPTGSGNGFARHNGFPLDYKKSLKYLFSLNSSKLIDVGYLNNIPFFNVSGIGFDAFVANEFQHTKNRGLLNYIKIAINSYKKYQNHIYNLQINNTLNTTKESFFISIANTNQFGNNFYIAPQADIADGLLDLVCVKKSSLSKMLLMAYDMFKGRVCKQELVSYTKIHNCNIQSPNMIVHIDGEPLNEKFDSIDVAVQTSALKLLSEF